MSDEPSASVGGFGFNGLAHSEETSFSAFSSIDPQEKVINNDTGESTKSRAHHIHKSASGDDSSSRGGRFSDGQEESSSDDDDEEERISSHQGKEAILQRIQENNRSDDDDDDDDEDDEDPSVELEDSPPDYEQFIQHETINKALNVQKTKYCMDPYRVEEKGTIHVYWYDVDKWYEGTVVKIPFKGFYCYVEFEDGDKIELVFQSAIWGVDGKMGSTNPPLSKWRKTLFEAVTKWETAPPDSHDINRLQIGDKIEFYNMFESYWSPAEVIRIVHYEKCDETGESETLYDLELGYKGTVLRNVTLSNYLWLFLTDVKDPPTECSKRTSDTLQLLSVSVYGGSSKKQRVSTGLVSVEGDSKPVSVCSTLPMDSPYPDMKRLHMLVEHLLGPSKYEEILQNGFINRLSSYPENVEVFLPLVSAVKSECSSDLSKSNSTSSTPTDVAVKALATMYDSDIGFLVPGM